MYARARAAPSLARAHETCIAIDADARARAAHGLCYRNWLLQGKVTEVLESLEKNGLVNNKDDAADAHTEELKALPTRQYLDKTVVPVLLDGITQLSKER